MGHAPPGNESPAVTGSAARPGRLRPDDVLTAVGLGACWVVWWPLLHGLQGPGRIQMPVIVAHVSGMLAGYGVVVLVGLMSRTPALERGIGADRLSRWHGAGGRIVVVLVLVHAWAAVVGWAETRPEGTLLAFWHVLRLPWLMAATVGSLMFLAVGMLSVRAARKHVSYETWHAIHLLVYLGVALSFVHQLAGPDLAGHRVLQLVWALLYVQVFTLVLRHRVLTPLRNAGRHRMRVQAVIPEGPGVVSIVIEGRDLHELEAESGQFFRWRFLAPDHWTTAHPFSLSAAPTSSHLRLTVKTLGDGSARLQDLEPGTWVLAEGPYGAMTAERRTRRHVLLVAGGVGITPMRALFETLPVEPGQDLLLLYRARSAEDLIFKAELDHIARVRGARVHYLVGSDIVLSPQAFRKLVPGLTQRDVYLCGPPGLATAVREALRGAGLPEAQLHEERFAF
ncbi:MAG: hypothetical protein QOE76_720 [Frankiales bacterium]|nr:hypothetical protein [Frankiales bacterium]